MDLSNVVAVEEKKVEALKSIAEALNAIAEALLVGATVQKQEVAYAINNVGAAISNQEAD